MVQMLAHIERTVDAREPTQREAGHPASSGRGPERLSGPQTGIFLSVRPMKFSSGSSRNKHRVEVSVGKNPNQPPSGKLTKLINEEFKFDNTTVVMSGEKGTVFLRNIGEDKGIIIDFRIEDVEFCDEMEDLD